VREFQYWTRNKLGILAGYLPAFNTASLRSSERLYIDLMAGEPTNRDRQTGEVFDGSARLALAASPPFTRLAFCEKPPRAAALEDDLRRRYPGRHFGIYAGDCNETIDQVLADLAPWNWAPTFAFIDQQAAEVHWRTLQRLASFRANPQGWKVELWILMSPAEIARGVAGTNGPAFAARVDSLFGNGDWRRIQAARQRESIGPADYRDEMVNLLRLQIEEELGYSMTARIPMRMPTGMPLYDMVFATDHWAGNKIMTHLYRSAAQREPEMIQEAKALARRQREDKAGMTPMFDIEPTAPTVDSIAWEPTEAWDPSGEAWW
jgi:three-Cys-motif partner protein